jgi:hypothetical protein
LVQDLFAGLAGLQELQDRLDRHALASDRGLSIANGGIDRDPPRKENLIAHS